MLNQTYAALHPNAKRGMHPCEGCRTKIFAAEGKYLYGDIYRGDLAVGRALQHLAIEVQALTVLTLRAVRILQRRRRAAECAPYLKYVLHPFARGEQENPCVGANSLRL